MRRSYLCALSASVLVTGSSGFAAPVDQFASSVIDFSSQWGSGSWSAAQALGAPNTFGYGDINTAWAPSSRNGSLEFITVGFSTPVYASEVTVRETDGNGFVYQIDVLDQANVLHTVWSGTDPSLPGSPVDFLVSFPQTAFLVKGVKVYTDTDHDPSNWEEIDSITLHGDTTRTHTPDGGTGLGLLALSCAGLARMRRRS